MKECELLETCVFINDYLSSLPSQIAMLKRQYCHSDYQKCARYKLAQLIDREKVPRDLDPTEHERAEQLLNSIDK